MSWLKAALGIVASAYVKDAVVRPRQLGHVARAYCDRVGKPLLLIHGGTLTHHLLGAPVHAEAKTTQAYPISVPTKTFGAVLAVGVLERSRRPDQAMTEWHRVADKVFVVVPSWWSPHTWLDPRHRWFVDSSLKVVAPLWTSVDGTRLLVVSDRGYGSPRCNPSLQTTSPMASRRPSISTQPSDHTPLLPAATGPHPSPPSPSLEDDPSDPYGEMLELPPDLPDSSSSGAEAAAFALGNEPSESWNSVSSLTVVSTPRSTKS